MKREEYIKKVLENYNPVNVLADKNDCKTIRLRHKKLGRDIVLHSLPEPSKIYDYLCGITSQNLPYIYDVLTLEDGQVVLEEFINGATIADILQGGKYRYLGAKRVIKSICAALEVLHKNGFVHRDIKPENVLIDENGRVVLIDFNASRKISNASKDTVIMGTVGYASPEQLGVSQSDARTDIYALGVLLNVMMCGKHPSEQFARGKAGRIVRKCTNVNPKDRYQTTNELYKAL